MNYEKPTATVLGSAIKVIETFNPPKIGGSHDGTPKVLAPNPPAYDLDE